MRKKVVLALWVLLLMGTGEPATANDSTIADTYPGHVEPREGNGNVVNVASLLVAQGTMAYYRLYGSWPADWAAVEKSGIVQRELVDYRLLPIDPDDGQVDSLGDLVFVAGNNGASPSYAVFSNNVSNGVELIELPAPPRTLSEVFLASGNQNLVNVAEDRARLAQINLGILLSQTLADHYMAKGSWPNNWSDFVSSGFAPVAEGALNPFNGDPILGDGSANDFKFFPSKGGNDAAYVLATDAGGATPWDVH